MTLKVCSIYDDGVKAYGPLVMFRAKGEATRWFSDRVNDPQWPLIKAPQDYTFMELGEFDDERGIVKMHTAHQSLGTGVEYLNKEQ